MMSAVFGIKNYLLAKIDFVDLFSLVADGTVFFCRFIFI